MQREHIMNIKKFKMGVDLGKGDYSVIILFEKVGSNFIIRRIEKRGKENENTCGSEKGDWNCINNYNDT